MVIQSIGLTASVISILGFLYWLGRTVYRQASAPKGYAAVLTGVSLISFTTFCAVLALFWLR